MKINNTYDGEGNIIKSVEVPYSVKDWEREMAETDIDIPRAIEDVIDALDGSTRAKISAVTLDKYNEKKAIRLRKPNDKTR